VLYSSFVILNSSIVILNLFQDNRQRHCIIYNRRAYAAPKEKAGAAMAAPASFALKNSGY
jgi:hypothetical protein